MGDTASVISSFYLSVAAHAIVSADPSLRYACTMLGSQPTNKHTHLTQLKRTMPRMSSGSFSRGGQSKLSMIGTMLQLHSMAATISWNSCTQEALPDADTTGHKQVQKVLLRTVTGSQIFQEISYMNTHTYAPTCPPPPPTPPTPPITQINNTLKIC